MAATTITRTKFGPPKIRLHCRLIAHQCCDQLTAVKTGYPLTSINWPYRGLKCRPIEVEYFLKLSTDKLPVSNNRRLKFIFPMIHMKSVVLMSLWPRTVQILISNWPWTRKFSYFLKNTGGEDLFLPWSRVGHYVQFLYSDWSKFDRWVHA